MALHNHYTTTGERNMRNRTIHHAAKQIGQWVVRLSGVPGSYTLHLIRDDGSGDLQATVSRGRKWEHMRGQFDLLVRFDPALLETIFDGIPVKIRRNLATGQTAIVQGDGNESCGAM